MLSGYDLISFYVCMWTYLLAQLVKNPAANAGDLRGADSIPGLGRSLGEGNGNPLQYSCLENPMDRGAGWSTVCEVAESNMTKYACAHTHTRGIHAPLKPSPQSSE